MWNTICNWHLATLRSFVLSWAHNKSWSEILQWNTCACVRKQQLLKSYALRRCTSVATKSLSGRISWAPTSASAENQMKLCLWGWCLSSPEVQETPLRAAVLPDWCPALPPPILTTSLSDCPGAALTGERRGMEWSFGNQQGQGWGNSSLEDSELMQLIWAEQGRAPLSPPCQVSIPSSWLIWNPCLVSQEKLFSSILSQ